MGLSLSTSRDNIGETSAYISYNVSLDNDWVSDFTISRFVIGNKSVPHTSSGTIKIDNLKPDDNCKATVNGSVTCEYYQDTWVGTDENGNDIYESKLYETKYDDSVSFYTHPGVFEDINAISAQDNSNSPNSIISNILTEEVINTKWIPHFKKAYQWYEQDSDVVYSPANQTYDYSSGRNNGGMKVKFNDPISAEWFNNCMAGMRKCGEKVEDVKKDQIITAKTINQMRFTHK